MIIRFLQRLCACMTVAPLFLFAGAGTAGSTAIDPEADRILRSMSDYVGSLKQFEFTGASTLDVVLYSGQKLQLGRTVKGAVKRPGRLHVEAEGDVIHQEIFLNEGKATLFGKVVNYYATADTPPAIGEALDFLFESFDLVAPGADLVQQDSYRLLTAETLSGAYVGLSNVSGVECHHLAFRGEELDWQIWIENSDTPLPRKYIITSKWVTGAPQYTAVITKWNTSVELTDDLFRFVPPDGAHRIEFIPFLNAASVKK